MTRKYPEHLVNRILERTAEVGDCWIWEGSTDRNGYGQIRYMNKLHYTHRVMADAPRDKNANHNCDNPACCNPNHLYVGTQSDNMYDRWQRCKNRESPKMKGSNHHKAKLDEHDVYGIKILLNNNFSGKDISLIFNCHHSTVNNINSGYQWGHVSL